MLNRFAKSVFRLYPFPADGLPLLTRMGSHLRGTILLLQLFTTGALGSVVVIAASRASKRRIALASDDSGRFIS
jgi:hypothetical protein